MQTEFVTANPDRMLVGPFSEPEISLILNQLLNTIDKPFKKSQGAPKTVLIDFFGTQKAYKTTVTGEIEKVFRRNKFKAVCPPETAEIDEVRSRLTDDATIEQAKHLTGVQDYLLNLAHHPMCHLAITSRGPKDMLYWYERGLRRGEYTEVHVQRVRDFIYELLKMDLIDAFVFFTCSVEAAMKREYGNSLTQKRGSKMNEKEVAETIDIYNSIIKGVQENIPGLPLYHIDTSEMSVREAAENVMNFLLPTICSRFNVPLGRIIPRMPSLIRNQVKQKAFGFEEQLKFIGYPDESKLALEGWKLVGEYWQEDTYLSPADSPLDPFGEIMRLRKDERGMWFLYKGEQRAMMFSHRFPYSLPINEAEAEEIKSAYKVAVVLNKKRRCYEKDGGAFTLHLDEIKELGKFTEIRTKGSAHNTHTEILLQLANGLGFSISAMREGNYLSFALKRSA